jgi:RNase P subunit RPR2
MYWCPACHRSSFTVKARCRIDGPTQKVLVTCDQCWVRVCFPFGTRISVEEPPV